MCVCVGASLNRTRPPATTAHIVLDWFEEHVKEFHHRKSVYSRFFNQAFVVCARKNSLIRVDSTPYRAC